MIADWWARLGWLAQTLSVIGALVVATLVIIVLRWLWIITVREPWERYQGRVEILKSHENSMRRLIDWKERSQSRISDIERRLNDVEKFGKRIKVLEQRWEQPAETGDLK